jgi:hypothetical protein
MQIPKNPVLFSFITYHRVCSKSITTGEACGTGMVTLPEHMPSLPVFSKFVLLDFFLCYVLLIMVCHFVLFPLVFAVMNENRTGL